MSSHSLDARGLICPLPVLKARKILLGLAAGDVLQIDVTDKAAPKDFALFCTETGHILRSVEETAQGAKVTVECRK
jgi:tRNA 2-thiouridine synthesizing protein A